MTLCLKKTWEMLMSGGTSKIPPVPIKRIQRKKWLKLLDLTLRTIRAAGTYKSMTCYRRLGVECIL